MEDWAENIHQYPDYTWLSGHCWSSPRHIYTCMTATPRECPHIGHDHRAPEMIHCYTCYFCLCSVLRSILGRTYTCNCQEYWDTWPHSDSPDQAQIWTCHTRPRLAHTCLPATCLDTGRNMNCKCWHMFLHFCTGSVLDNDHDQAEPLFSEVYSWGLWSASSVFCTWRRCHLCSGSPQLAASLWIPNQQVCHHQMLILQVKNSVIGNNM